MKRTWSYSALGKFEKCPQSWAYQKIDRLPDPSSPAMRRGNKIHAKLENAVRTGEPSALDDIDKYVKKEVRNRPWVAEEMWVFDKNWKFLGIGGNNKWYDDAWLYAKLDVYLPPTPRRAPRVVDWKTGGIYPEHKSQAHLYALAAVAREAQEIKAVEVHMVYTDRAQIDVWKVEMNDAAEQRADWTERANALITATEFPRKPGRHCDWCSFSKRQGGPCDERA